jgi:mannose-1-phosphate guanylyltransferase/mannose-6-phosphate isomerase
LNFLILAGGGGTRLWPLSRQEWPKQFLSLTAEPNAGSLLVETALRVGDSGAALASTYIVTSDSLQPAVLKDFHASGLPIESSQIICEPMRKNTAPAIALAAEYVWASRAAEIATDSECVLAILPADHQIEDAAVFRQHLQQAESLARQGYIVTLGVPPTHPETGYGYIEVSENYSERPWLPVKRFVEKPDLPTAESYVKSQRFLWNAGIFVLTLQTLRQALCEHAPAIAELLSQGYETAYRRFNEMPNISFDYAVMEKAAQVAVIPMHTGWSDVGSWDSVFEKLPRDVEGNASLGERDTIFINSRNTATWSETGRTIATIGLENCLIIDTPDALLITQQGASQDVREVVSQLERTQCATLRRPTRQRHSWGELQQLNPEQEDALPVYQLTLHPQLHLILETQPTTCSLVLLQGELVAASNERRLDRGPLFAAPGVHYYALETLKEPVRLLCVGIPPVLTLSQSTVLAPVS